MTAHHDFFADQRFGDASRKIVISLPGGRAAIAAPWFKAARPGDVGGVTEFSAPVYMTLKEFDTVEEAQSDWRRMAGL